tara:strand:- start:93 stop:356 length:264 start_codon:yes stop_codon:yes gene_type:complete
MLAGEIFQKTARGRAEMKVRSNALSMRDRRVLILVNGERNASFIKQQSLTDNIIETLENLEKLGFIARLSSRSDTQFEAEAVTEASF